MGELFERLFEPKRSKHTWGSVLGTFLLFLVLGNILFILFFFEEQKYGDLQAEYGVIERSIALYLEEVGELPLKEAESLSRYKDLESFLVENNLTHGQWVAPVDMEALSLPGTFRHRYLYDLETDRLYTEKAVVYRFKRWHAPLID